MTSTKAWWNWIMYFRISSSYLLTSPFAPVLLFWPLVRSLIRNFATWIWKRYSQLIRRKLYNKDDLWKWNFNFLLTCGIYIVVKMKIFMIKCPVKFQILRALLDGPFFCIIFWPYRRPKERSYYIVAKISEIFSSVTSFLIFWCDR